MRCDGRSYISRGCLIWQSLSRALISQIVSRFNLPDYILHFNLADRVYHVTQLENRRSKPGKPTALKQRIIKYGAYHVLYYGWYYPLQMLYWVVDLP